MALYRWFWVAQPALDIDYISHISHTQFPIMSLKFKCKFKLRVCNGAGWEREFDCV